MPATLPGNLILPAEWYRDLSTRYGETTRAYHTLEHISSLLELLEQHAAVAHDKESIAWAIWFHDAIYDPRETTPGGNEEASVRLLQQFIADRPSDVSIPCMEKLQKIIHMIRATINHLPPSDLPTQELADLKLFLDFDLEVLSRSHAEYNTYAEQIRREYAHYPDDAYRSGRINVLKRFLGREKIYFTPGELWESKEKAARQNLEREIKEIETAQQTAVI